MIKKTMIATAVYLLVIFGLYSLIYRFDYQLDKMSNILLIVGFLSASAGLLSITNAQNVFIGFRYFFKNLTRRRDEEKVSFYDYKEEKYHNEHTYLSKLILFVGLFIVMIAIVLAFIHIKK